MSGHIKLLNLSAPISWNCSITFLQDSFLPSSAGICSVASLNRVLANLVDVLCKDLGKTSFETRRCLRKGKAAKWQSFCARRSFKHVDSGKHFETASLFTGQNFLNLIIPLASRFFL